MGCFAEVQSCRESVFTPTCTSHPTAIHPLQLSYTPGGSERCTRLVEESFTPKLKMQFVDFDSAMCFFVVYAISFGFEPRLYTTKRTRGGELLRKSIVCNRQGYRENKNKLKCPVTNVEKDSTVKPYVSRNVKITRIGCPAMMRVEATGGGGCRVDQFVAFHNHRLLSINDKEFQKVVRKLSCFQKKIIDNSKLQLGASISFQQCKEYADGYANVGATLTDFKNFARDVKCFIGLKDVTLFVNHLEELAKIKPGFYFAHEIDDQKCLSRVFWSDAESRKNYAEFGDAVSFDATYGTNKYGIIFTPFTGVDHHKRSVTFACSLLDHENKDSFTWCFKKFLDCMGQKEPLCIVTDQDAGIDMPMGGLLRTTQRPESSNSFYKRYQTHFGTLVEFWMRFETAMEQQRYLQNVMIRTRSTALLTTAVATKIELHAASVYTYKVFYDVQVELKNTSSCGLAGMPVNGDVCVYDINDELRYSTFQVSYNVATQEVNCSCKLFESKGLLCRHVFWVFLANLLKSIPSKFIVPRWCKASYRNPFSILPSNIIEDCDPPDVIKMEISNVWSEFYSTIGVAKSLPVDRIKELAALLKSFREEFSPSSSSEVLSKEKEIEQLLGFTSSS
ncbi:protein FAR1-RELATED SEQUENCE 5-like [Silene latifolia]|uniref:protein FAR1-RELATED SEQUENCE 5-like n=1 Tax=Silene latifolia TaxID=37657 RepID=UPI003D773B50